MSERDGWNHVYVVSRDGKSVRLVTRGAFDVVKVLGTDERGGWVYYLASPDQPSQRYLYRTRLNGRGSPERLSPRGDSGTHAYDRAPNFRYALETYSSFGQPPVVRLVRLPGHEILRTLIDNAGLRARLATLRKGAGRVLQHPGGGRGQDAGLPDEAGGLRLHPEVSASPSCVRWTRQLHGERCLGLILSLAPDAHPAGLPRGQRGQPRNAGPAGPRLAQVGLRAAGCARNPGSGRRGPHAGAEALR